MLIKSLRIQDGLSSREYDFSALTVVHSVHNGVGKTTLLRCLLYALGYAVPSMKGLRFDKLEFTLFVVSGDGVQRELIRHGMLMAVRAEGAEERYSLPYEQHKLHELIFGIAEQSVLDNLLGTYYFDQEKGWTLLNRGKVVGKISFSIENFLRGLSGCPCQKECDELAVVSDDIHKYQQMLSVAVYKEEIFEGLGDKPTEEVRKDILQLQNECVPLERERARLQGIIAQNNSFEKYIGSMGLRVRGKNDPEIPVTIETIIGFKEIKNLVLAKLEEIDYRLASLRGRIRKAEARFMQAQELFEIHSEADAKSFDRDLLRIQIDKDAVERMISKLKVRQKRLRTTLQRALMTGSTVVSDLTKLVLFYVQEFGLDKKYGLDVFTSDLKSLSGAILHRMVFAFRISYIKLIAEKTGCRLPIIIDSPNGREVEKKLVDKMMSILLRDFSDHQIIIATIYNKHYSNQNVITVNNGVIHFGVNG